MKTTVSLSDFRDAFYKADRKDQFSYEGLGVLFNWIEDFEEGTGEEIELDVIALCCDFTEATYAEVADDYGIDLTDIPEADIPSVVTDYLNDNTTVVGHVGDDSVIYSAF